VLRAHKPVFIDKPLAGTLADAVEIVRLAEETGTPCFSSSSLRFTPALLALKTDPKLGAIQGCETYSPCSLEEHHPDLFWYGVHGVEMLYTLMGTGCERVSRVQTKDTELVAGVWKDGRIGTFRGLRARPGYGALVFGAKDIMSVSGSGGYEPLLVEICAFFRTGKPPVALRETLEILAFMEAADESKRQGGAPVALETVLSRASAEAAARRSSAGNPQGAR
jgi:predicted dehydrogenase